MAFSGGGSNILKPHTHSSAILQDGGSLRLDGITQGNLAAGSLTQSDGNSLTELAIGTPAQIPRVNAGATAVEYFTPTEVGEDLTNKGSIHGCNGGSVQTEVLVGTNYQTLVSDSTQASGIRWGDQGKMELLGTQTLAAAGPTLTVSGLWLTTDYAYYIIEGGFSNDNSVGTPSLEMQLNGSALPNYHTNMLLNTAGVLTATTSGIATSGTICTSNVCPPSSNETCQTTITLELSVQPAPPTYRFNWSNTWMWDQGGIVPSDVEQICGIFGNNSVTQLSEVKFFFSDSSNFRIGSNIFLYGIRR